MHDEDKLIRIDSQTEMEIAADALARLIAAGVELTSEQLEVVSDGVRKRVELRLVRGWLADDVAAGRLPGRVLTEFDRWAAGERERFPLPG